MTEKNKKQDEPKTLTPVIKKEEVSEYKEQRQSIENMIAQAVSEKVPIETLERFLAMRKELKAEYAKEQFDNAMAKFQRECPEIKKVKQVKDKNGKVLYSYAPIDEIVRQAKEAIGSNGLSYTIKTENSKNDKGETQIKSICIVKHIAGHREESEMQVPLGVKTDIMSNSQVIAAAATFSKRYAFCNAFGIMTGDEDKEENLKDAPANEVEEAKKIISQCQTIEALKETWSGFSKELKGNKEVITHTNQIKGNIQHANTQIKSA